MGIFKRKPKIHTYDSGKTPVKFKGRLGEPMTLDAKKRKRKKIKRIVLSVVLLLVLGTGVFFGAKAYIAVKKIFAEGGDGILNLWGGDQGQALRADSNGRTNVLILGVGDEGHAGATLSDTNIIVSLNSSDKKVAMFSVPRDLYVEIPKNGYAKINSANAYGEQNKYPGGGMALAKETFEKTFNTQIHYVVRVDFSGLEEAVDALGGVTIDVENAFCDYNYPVERKGDKSTICFDKGQVQMNGARALQYSRSRHALGPEGSDFARSKRQQKVMVAIKEKALSTNTVFNAKKVVDLLTALSQHVKVEPPLQIGELTRAYDLSKQIDASKIINRNFDNSVQGLLIDNSSTAAGYTLRPRTGNFKEIQAVIKNIFEISKYRDEKASIIILNGTWNTGAAQRLSDDLKAQGFNVVSTGSADTKNYTKSEIIDFSGGKKPATIKALEDKLDVTAESQTGDTASFEIKIILGKDFKG